MARPVTINADDLLVAARSIFLEKGSHATTAQVAERAGVSEGTLFKRFGTKAALFRAAMEVGASFDPFENIERLVGTGEVNENLVTLGRDLVRFFEELMPIMTMQWSNPRMGQLPPLLDVPDAPPLRAHRKLAAYLDAEVALGRATIPNTAAFARAFMGALNAYVFFEMLTRSHRQTIELDLPADVYVESFVASLWNGVAPKTRASISD